VFGFASLVDGVKLPRGLSVGWTEPGRPTVLSECLRRLGTGAGMACSEVEDAGCGSELIDS
jgi:hypothetical protein